VCSQLWLRLVVCIRDGASCSGLVCTLSYVLERLKVEHDIDIFHSVRHARINRLQIIPVFVSLLFFHFCMLCQCCLTNFSALLFHAKLACSLASPGQIGLPYGFHSPLVSIGNILFFQICLFFILLSASPCFSQSLLCLLPSHQTLFTFSYPVLIIYV